MERLSRAGRRASEAWAHEWVTEVGTRAQSFWGLSEDRVESPAGGWAFTHWLSRHNCPLHSQGTACGWVGGHGFGGLGDLKGRIYFRIMCRESRAADIQGSLG